MANEAQGITAIAVSGFKSLRDESRIEVRPLTILAGANSSGKSSIMQPLLLMKQTLEAPYDPGPLLLNGPNVVFTDTEQFFSKLGSNKQANQLTTGLEINGHAVLTNTLSHLATVSGIELAKMDFSYGGIGGIDGTLYPGMPKQEMLTLTEPHRFGDDVEVIRNRCFLEIHSVVMRYVVPGDIQETVRSAAFSPASPFQFNILKLIHIAGLRGNPKRTYLSTPVSGPMFAGTFEHYLAGVLRHWFETENSRAPSKLANYLTSLGLTSSLGVGWVGQTEAEIRVGRTMRSGNDDLVSIADVGFGVSQVLPVLVALLVAEPGQLVYIEQPELHLHPRAQVALAQVLADAANRGVRVVAETHSALLIEGIQTLVAQEKISSDKIMLHWFARDEDGCTKISSQELDQYGAYRDFWPEDFAEVQLEADSAYLDAVEQRQQGELHGGQKPEMSGD